MELRGFLVGSGVTIEPQTGKGGLAEYVDTPNIII
mgnify:CR=1 FL=1